MPGQSRANGRFLYMKINNTAIFVLRCAIMMLIASFSACTPTGSRSQLSPTPDPQYLVHEVRFPGETLGIIAQWYTGSSKNWKRIHTCNRQLDADRIEIGSRINIPIELVVREAPLTRTAVTAAYRHHSGESTTHAPAGLKPVAESEKSPVSPQHPERTGQERALAGGRTDSTPASHKTKPGTRSAAHGPVTGTEAGSVAAGKPNSATLKTEQGQELAPAERKQLSRDELLKELLSSE